MLCGTRPDAITSLNQAEMHRIFGGHPQGTHHDIVHLARRALKVGELHIALDTLRDGRSRKKFIKHFERQLKDDFEEPLKNLSINQGKILVKLINRETGNTAYEVIKEFRSSFSAFLWQKLAWLYGNDLKTRYDPTSGEDQSIEYIVQMIEAGLINQD